MFREEFVERYFPIDIDGKPWRAIAWTTAASVSAVVELVATGAVPKKDFKTGGHCTEVIFATKTGSLYKKSMVK